MWGSGLVIDAFDTRSRQFVTEWCQQHDLPCLHVGLADGYAEVIWNDNYRVPSVAQDDICDYPLVRNLVLLAVAVASETINRYITQGEQRTYTITRDDFNVLEDMATRCKR